MTVLKRDPPRKSPPLREPSKKQKNPSREPWEVKPEEAITELPAEVEP
jgi:hypothetical protein